MAHRQRRLAVADDLPHVRPRRLVRRCTHQAHSIHTARVAGKQAEAGAVLCSCRASPAYWHLDAQASLLATHPVTLCPVCSRRCVVVLAALIGTSVSAHAPLLVRLLPLFPVSTSTRETNSAPRVPCCRCDTPVLRPTQALPRTCTPVRTGSRSGCVPGTLGEPVCPTGVHTLPCSLCVRPLAGLLTRALPCTWRGHTQIYMMGVICVFAAAFVVEALIYQHSMKGASARLLWRPVPSRTPLDTSVD
jgi:hypothetical protein